MLNESKWLAKNQSLAQRHWRGFDKYLTYEYDATTCFEVGDKALLSDVQNGDSINFDAWNVLAGVPKRRCKQNNQHRQNITVLGGRGKGAQRQ